MVIKRGWQRLVASGVLYSTAGFAGLGCLVGAAFLIGPIQGLAALGAALLFVAISVPEVTR